MATHKPPWDRARPPKPPKKLSAAQKASAKARAKKAGRPYPNLVDNMAEATKAKRTKGK